MIIYVRSVCLAVCHPSLVPFFSTVRTERESEKKKERKKERQTERKTE